MILDFQTRELSYIKNEGINLGTIYDIHIAADIKYKMALVMSNEEMKIQLVDFKCVNAEL